MRSFIVASVVLALFSSGATAASPRQPLALDAASAGFVPTGILYDRVVPFSYIRDHDGRSYHAASRASWRQMYFEMQHASLEPWTLPALDALDARVTRPAPGDAIPVAIANFRYNRLGDGAAASGAVHRDGERLVIENAGAVESARVFAAAPMVDHTYRGGRAAFRVDRGWYFSNDDDAPADMRIDLDDGAGFRSVAFGDELVAAYATTGVKQIRLRATTARGEVLRAAFVFRVETLQAPTPDDTLSVTATIPYNTEYGTGEAYVYLADTHTTITQPVVLIEGFDIDNNMNWDELYALLNDEGLAEQVRADGYDLVVMNFDDATDYIQKNAFAVLDLLEQVQAAISPQAHYVLVGASMGGLCARFALSYMETNAIAHQVSTYISFDTPQGAANIPLGIQYWLDFFQGNSADAAALLASLDRPAARQMLAYHHTTPPGSTGQTDPLRTAFDADLAALGDYPSIPRKVAMANGSGAGMTQGFGAGAQIITWNYSVFPISLRGNVWAVPDGTLTRIFEGRLTIFGLGSTSNISVSGTAPYDNAPGGWRSSMAQMDSVSAPYGDIVANYPNHCFIPVVSALDLDTSDLFYDVDGDPNILDITPFDAVYFPAENQPHVDITPENKQWILDEIHGAPTPVRTDASALALSPNVPNPFNPSTAIRFVLPERGQVRVDVYDVSGALVATLVDGVRDAGPGVTTWNGRDAAGRAVASGVYFCRLTAGSETRTRKMVLVK